MDISVCIPIYNSDVINLTDKLLSQLKNHNIGYEIVLIDDASVMQYKQLNRELHGKSKVKYIELSENIGRSSIRNLFLQHAKFDNLLFLDSDTVIDSNMFIANYLSAMQNDYSVIYGGRTYGLRVRKRQCRLRWKYGVERECKDLVYRQKHCYQSFMSNNFLIKKSIFSTIKFDERLRHYGYEDSLFAYNLMIKKINLKHIHNPTIHNYNESASDFLRKTAQALNNLVFINEEVVKDSRFSSISKLSATYYRLRERACFGILKPAATVINPVILFLLKHGIVSLKIFDTYKFLYFVKKINTYGINKKVFF